MCIRDSLARAQQRRRWRDVARRRQFAARAASSAGPERIFSKAGRGHGDLQKSVLESSLELNMKASYNADLPVIETDDRQDSVSDEIEVL